jgi:hypothetical protein
VQAVERPWLQVEEWMWASVCLVEIKLSPTKYRSRNLNRDDGAPLFFNKLAHNRVLRQGRAYARGGGRYCTTQPTRKAKSLRAAKTALPPHVGISRGKNPTLQTAPNGCSLANINISSEILMHPKPGPTTWG